MNPWSRNAQFPDYVCQAEGIRTATPICQNVPGAGIDTADLTRPRTGRPPRNPDTTTETTPTSHTRSAV